MPNESLPAKRAPDEPYALPRGKGPRKGRDAPRSPRIKGKLPLKPKVAAGVKKGARARKGGPAMVGATVGDQAGLKSRADVPDRYVRLRVRVEDGDASIVDSHVVESTLVQPPEIHANFAYEVTVGGRRLHVDSIPDLGVTRSFANPNGPPEQQRHHTQELAEYEFDVRVPARELTRAALPNVSIVLYRAKDRMPAMAMLREAPLNVQFERELREVVRLDGISADALRGSLSMPRTGPARGKRKRAK